MAQIFLSYCREDAEAAQLLAHGLGDGGHSVWWDRHISGGSKFAAEIQRALDAADVVIVLWSKDAVGSAWVLDEAAEGRDSGRLLPLALDGCRPPLGFRQYQTFAVRPDHLPRAVEELLSAVALRTGEGSGRSVPHGGRAATEPNSSEAHIERALHLEKQGAIERAWESLEAALAAEPPSAGAHREAGRFLYEHGRIAEAAGHLEQALAELPRDHESPAMLMSWHHRNRDDAALRQVAEVALARAELEIASGRATALAFASGAKALAALGHSDRARKWVRKALNVEPGNLKMRYVVAAALAEFFGDPDAALDVLEPVVEAASTRSDLHLLGSDPAWDAIRNSGAFESLVARARKRVEALEKSRPQLSV